MVSQHNFSNNSPAKVTKVSALRKKAYLLLKQVH